MAQTQTVGIAPIAVFEKELPATSLYVAHRLRMFFDPIVFILLPFICFRRRRASVENGEQGRRQQTSHRSEAVFMQANSARVLENAERKIIPAGVGRRHLFSYSSSGVLHRWAKCAQEFSDVAAVVKKDRI